MLRETYQRAGVILIDIPEGLETDQRVRWIARRVADGGMISTEPHKCARIEWFPLDQLPAITVPYSRAGIGQFRRGEHFGLQGWSRETVTG